MNKAQTWSMDVLVAASVFIAGMIIFFYILNYSSTNGKVDDLSAQAELIPENLIATDESSASSTTIVVGSQVDSARLNSLASMDYRELKNKLGVNADFCIHFEDEDGNLMDINESPDGERYSIGDPRLSIIVTDSDGNDISIACGS